MLIEPKDRDTDNSNSLDKRCNAICDGRSKGEDREGNQVLAPMNNAIEEEVKDDNLSTIRDNIGWGIWRAPEIHKPSEVG